jgi:hypothetical protein
VNALNEILGALQEVAESELSMENSEVVAAEDRGRKYAGTYRRVLNRKSRMLQAIEAVALLDELVTP